jgi:hypothetical protein
MYPINTVIEYKGYTLTKKGKSYWIVSKDGKWGYTTTLKGAKEMAERKIKKELFGYAEELILSMGGNKADIEQITDEIKESRYSTIEEIKLHLENYYM